MVPGNLLAQAKPNEAGIDRLLHSLDKRMEFSIHTGQFSKHGEYEAKQTATTEKAFASST